VGGFQPLSPVVIKRLRGNTLQPDDQMVKGAIHQGSENGVKGLGLHIFSPGNA